jgi:hypothetical protein
MSARIATLTLDLLFTAAYAAPLLGNAIEHRLICSMVVIEKIDFIPIHAKNNVPTTGRGPQDSQVKAAR